MTEKQRFEYDYKTGRIYDNESDWQGTKNPLHWVTRLNNFNEQYNKLKGENEKLKQDLSEYCNFSLHDVLDKKNKEIEQLKSEIQKLKNVSTN